MIDSALECFFAWESFRYSKQPFLKVINSISEAVVRRCFIKKVFLKISQNSPAPEAYNFIKKTLAQVYSCGFCEIFKNNFFCRAPAVNALVCFLCLVSFLQLLIAGYKQQFLNKNMHDRNFKS